MSMSCDKISINQQIRISKEKEQLQKLIDFVKFIDDHITDTCNAGFVLTNITPEMLKEKCRDILEKDQKNAK